MRRVLLLLAACSSSMGCHPELPDPGGTAEGGDGGAAAAPITVEIEPAAPLDAVARVVRFHVRIAAPSVAPAPEQLVLATGELGPAHLRQLAEGDLSNALTARLLPTRSWVEEVDGGVVVHVAPATLLEPGETYTLAAGEPELATVIEVAEEDPWPLLSRRWPPPGASATQDLAVWCGEDVVDRLSVPIELAPRGPAGVLHAGVAPGVGSSCLRFDAELPASSEATQPVPFEDAPVAVGWLPPPFVESSAGRLLIEPSPLVADVEAFDAPASASCDPAMSLPFGPGCARLLDDRLLVSAPDTRLLWAVAGEGLQEVRDVQAGGPMVLFPLPPSSAVSLEVVTIDAAGRVAHEWFQGTTAAPMPHVVVNEVLANPLGAEPQQEWVELYNSGLEAAQLAGYLLEDVGGSAVLPAGTLPPGKLALLVGEGFVEDDLLDPAVPPGALVLVVDKLGKNGLSNSGEPITLRDPSGAVVSRFPPLPKPKPGQSVSRVDPLAPDELPSSFAATAATPAAPN